MEKLSLVITILAIHFVPIALSGKHYTSKVNFVVVLFLYVSRKNKNPVRA